MLDVGCLSDDVYWFVLDGEVSVIHVQLLKKEDKKANPREVAQRIMDNLPSCELIGKV